MKSLGATLALALLAACASPGSQDDVPKEIAVHAGSIPVLQVTFRATESGYTLIHVGHTLGTPTLALDPDREVLVTARNARGEPIVALSVPNPRVATGEPPDNCSFVLFEAVLNLRFPEPEPIHSLETFVSGGPNKGLRQVFTID